MKRSRVVITIPDFKPKAGESAEQTARRLRKYNDVIRAVRRWRAAAVKTGGGTV